MKDTKSPFIRYLSCSIEDKTPCMLCTAAGFGKVKPGTVYPLRKKDHPVLFRPVVTGRVLSEFQLIYIPNGEGIFTSGETTYQVKPGSTLLLLPGLRHAYRPLSETGWHEYWVGFRGAYFLDLVETGCLSQEKVFFETGLHDSILSLCNQIFDEVLYQRPLYQMRTCSSILSLIAEVLDRERRRDIPDYYQQVLEKAKLLMEANISGAANMTDIASQLGTSASNFHRIFKIYTSMTPYQYFIAKKIHKAESLLGQTDLSVKEVAAQLGFENQLYFSRLFKKKIGVSPLNWKKYINIYGNPPALPEDSKD